MTATMDPMTYTGPATVTADGATIPVIVNLRAHNDAGRDNWRGDLTAADGVALLNVYEGRLCLPDGRESGFVRTGGGMPGGPIRVEGSSGDKLL